MSRRQRPALYAMTYLSYSRIAPHSVDMLDIERASLRNNAPDGISGFLYFDGTFFLQVLEGTRPALDGLISRLRKDPRHYAMRILRDCPLQARQFGGWSMAFCDGTARHALFGFTPMRTELQQAGRNQPGDILTRLDNLRPD